MATLRTPKFGDLDFGGEESFWSFTDIPNYENDITSRMAYNFDTNKGRGSFTFLPEEFITKGLVNVTTNNQYYGSAFLDSKFLGDLLEKGQLVDLRDVIPPIPYNRITNPRPPTAADAIAPKWFEANFTTYPYGAGLSGRGVLIPRTTFNDMMSKNDFKLGSYRIGMDVNKVGVGPIEGMGAFEGQTVYKNTAYGDPKRKPIAYLTSDGLINTKREKGGFFADVAREIAAIPLLPEIAGVITRSPQVYATLKGLQLGMAGVDPLKAGALVGATIYAQGITDYSGVGKAFGIQDVATQKIVGNAIANSALSGFIAALTDGDIGKSMLQGAAVGAGMAGAGEVSNAILGKETIQSISASTNLTVPQVEKLITGSLVAGVINHVNDQDFGEGVVNSLISNGIGQSVANSIGNNIKDSFKGREALLAGILNTSKETVKVATNAILTNQDVKDALEKNIPGIILSASREYSAVQDQLKREVQIREKQKELSTIAQEAEQILNDSTQIVALPIAAIGGIVTGAHAALLYILSRLDKTFPNDPEAQQQALEQLKTNPVVIKILQQSPTEPKIQVNPTTKKPELKPVLKPEVEQQAPEPTKQFIEKINADIGKLSGETQDYADEVFNALVKAFEDQQQKESKAEEPATAPTPTIPTPPITDIATVGKPITPPNQQVIQPIQPDLGQPVPPAKESPEDVLIREIQKEKPVKPTIPTPPATLSEEQRDQMRAGGTQNLAGIGAVGVPSFAPPTQTFNLQPPPAPEVVEQLYPGKSNQGYFVEDTGNGFQFTFGDGSVGFNGKLIIEGDENVKFAFGDFKNTFPGLVVSPGQGVTLPPAPPLAPPALPTPPSAPQTIEERYPQQAASGYFVQYPRIYFGDGSIADQFKGGAIVQGPNEAGAQFFKTFATRFPDDPTLRLPPPPTKPTPEAPPTPPAPPKPPLEPEIPPPEAEIPPSEAPFGTPTEPTAPPFGEPTPSGPPTAPQKDQFVAPQQPDTGAGGGGVTDQDILDAIKSGGGGATTGPEGGGGAPEGGKAGEGAPAGEGGPGVDEGAAGEGTGEGGISDEEILDELLNRLQLQVVRKRPEITTGEQERTLSPRVTGEALASILGEKEPLFGGDEDAQRAVWNRRSLRLRRALGL